MNRKTPFHVEPLQWDDKYIRELRRPRAYFDVLVTSKGNLALDWYPTKMRVINPDLRKYAPTARKFSHKSAKMTPTRAKKLVLDLFVFPDIYGAVLEQPPPGVQPMDQKGKIIYVSFSKNRNN